MMFYSDDSIFEQNQKLEVGRKHAKELSSSFFFKETFVRASVRKLYPLAKSTPPPVSTFIGILPLILSVLSMATCILQRQS